MATVYQRRIFVYEHICAAGSTGKMLAEHFRAEGTAMLSAALDDFHRLPDVTTSILWDARYPARVRAHAVHTIRPHEEQSIFRKCAAEADRTFVIAPECEDILATRCRWVEEAGGRLLGPSVNAVRLTGDKLALAQHLQHHGVPTPRCVLVADAALHVEFPAVWKPRDGAGSTATFLCSALSDCRAAQECTRQEGWEGEAVLQTFVSGQPASVAVLVGPAQTLALMPAEQHLSADGRFHYLGGKIPIAGNLVERAQRLALQAVMAVPGLKGYVGVDLNLADADDGSQDWVIEINPRLTTSYIGLRKMTEANLMAVLLDIVAGKPVVPIVWRPGSVVFTSDGTILS